MKFIMASISIAVMSVMLTGCGGDDNSVYGPGGANNGTGGTGTTNEIKFSTIHKYYESAMNNTSFAIRDDYVLRDGSIQTTETPIKGLSKTDNEISIIRYLAPGFSKTISATVTQFNSIVGPTIDVLSPTKYSYIIKSDNNGKQLTYTNELKAFDVSNVTYTDSKRFEIRPFKKFDLTTSTLPKGSLCYEYIAIKPSFNVFEFEVSDTQPEPETTLEAWVANQNKEFSTLRIGPIVNVGENNEYRAISVADGTQSWGAVEINAKVYRADYSTPDMVEPIVNPDVAAIECEVFNDIAADYIASEVKRYGK